MARRGSYGFERWRKESARRAKQEAKRQRKSDRVQEGATGPEMGEPVEGGAPEGLHEWFSPSRGRVVTARPGERPVTDPPDDWILLTETPGPAAESDSPPPADPA